MRICIAVTSLMMGLAVPGLASADILASSTFDSDAQGWTVGDFLTDTGSSAPTYLASGGNPGGFIRTGDLFSFNSYHAPSAFLGDQSAAYGGSIQLDERIVSGDGVDQAMVVISDGTLLLQFRTAQPGTDWTSYSIPLLASAGWQIATDGSAAGPAATEAQLQQVLGNLLFLHIDADWQTGSDQVDLDNVILSSSGAVPEPSTLALMGLGGLALAIGRKRFRRA